jgi:uncharacterized protein YndB with AHSA1/START domain
MKRFSAETRIKAPPEAIWRVLADIPGWASWDPNTNRAEGLAEKDKPLTFAFAYAPGRSIDVKITAIDEPYLLEWTGGDEQLSFMRAHRITPRNPKEGEGSRFEVSQEFSGRAADNVRLPQLDKSFGEFCAALKQRVEAGSS